MDGTGSLFDPFLKLLPGYVRPMIISYPTHLPMSYEELAAHARAKLPRSEPYVLVAESFSGPIALLLAAEADRNLRAVTLVASFASTPFGARGRLIARLPWRIIFLFLPPLRVLRWLLMEPSTPKELVGAVQRAIKCVAPMVLASRVTAALVVDLAKRALDSPVRLVCLNPDRDRLLGTEASRRLSGLSPGIESFTIPGPHLLLQCVPHSCVSAMAALGLLDRIDGDA